MLCYQFINLSHAFIYYFTLLIMRRYQHIIFETENVTRSANGLKTVINIQILQVILINIHYVDVTNVIFKWQTHKITQVFIEWHYKKYDIKYDLFVKYRFAKDVYRRTDWYQSLAKRSWLNVWNCIVCFSWDSVSSQSRCKHKYSLNSNNCKKISRNLEFQGQPQKSHIVIAAVSLSIFLWNA